MPVADDNCFELNDSLLLKKPVFDRVSLHLRKRRTVDGRSADVSGRLAIGQAPPNRSFLGRPQGDVLPAVQSGSNL
jgi:hypothetical protein